MKNASGPGGEGKNGDGRRVKIQRFVDKFERVLRIDALRQTKNGLCGVSTRGGASRGAKEYIEDVTQFHTCLETVALNHMMISSRA